MDYLENLLQARSSFSFDQQIRYLGWSLLLLWMLSIIYMTREFWFPAAFVKRPRYEYHNRSMKRRHPPSEERRFTVSKPNPIISQLSDYDLRLLADESRKKCQHYLMKHSRSRLLNDT